MRLRLLVEVGRRGSISAAADACRVGQPSATKHLQTLEAAVGAKLVERRGRASRLTEAGAVVAAHGQRVLDTLEGMREDLRALEGAERGTLSLAALADQTLLVRERGSSTRAVADRRLAKAGYRPAKRWELDSNEAIKRSVQAGLGIGFVSKLVVADELERGELVAFEVDGAEPMLRSVIQEYLDMLGYRDFAIAGDGREAVLAILPVS